MEFQKADKIVGTRLYYVSGTKRIAAIVPDMAEVVRLGKTGMPDVAKITKQAEPLRSEMLVKVEDGTKPIDAIYNFELALYCANGSPIEMHWFGSKYSKDLPWPIITYGQAHVRHEV